MAVEKLALMNKLLAGTDNVFISQHNVDFFYVPQVVASSLVARFTMPGCKRRASHYSPCFTA